MVCQEKSIRTWSSGSIPHSSSSTMCTHRHKVSPVGYRLFSPWNFGCTGKAFVSIDPPASRYCLLIPSSVFLKALVSHFTFATTVFFYQYVSLPSRIRLSSLFHDCFSLTISYSQSSRWLPAPISETANHGAEQIGRTNNSS